MAALPLTGDPAADALLAEDALALLIGMLLDQQVPMERAFHSPYDLKERLGGRLDAAEIAGMDAEALATVFKGPPALHRFPGSMAGRTQDMCRVLVERYDGDAARVWTDADTGTELFANLRVLPGFGEQKARIFVALLGKQLGVQPRGWQAAAGDYGKKGTYMSVADITDEATLGRVRQFKADKKAAAKAAKATDG